MTRKGSYFDNKQINKLYEEFSKDKPDLSKAIKLFKDLFESLVRNNIGSFRMEVDELCEFISNRPDYFTYPDAFRDIIFKCRTLHDYPNEYAMSSPDKILNEINVLFHKKSLY